MSRLSRPGARAGANARDSSIGLVAGGLHDENRGAQLATTSSRMGRNPFYQVKKWFIRFSARVARWASAQDMPIWAGRRVRPLRIACVGANNTKRVIWGGRPKQEKTMTPVTVRLTLTGGWWARWYIAGVSHFADTMGLGPDPERMAQTIERGLRVKASRVWDGPQS